MSKVTVKTQVSLATYDQIVQIAEDEQRSIANVLRLLIERGLTQKRREAA